MKFLNEIKTDLKNGDHLEIYVSISLAIVIAILGILNAISYEVLSATILGILGILAGSLLSVNKSSQKLQESNNQLKSELQYLHNRLGGYSLSEIFTKGYPDLHNEFNNAVSIDILGSSLVTTANQYYGDFERAVNRGSKLRFIAPSTKSNIVEMMRFTMQAVSDANSLKSLINFHTQRLNSLEQSDKTMRLVEIKSISCVLPYGLISIKKNRKDDGCIFVKLYSFQTIPGQFRVMKIEYKDTEMYNFFLEQFEKFWDAATYE